MSLGTIWDAFNQPEFDGSALLREHIRISLVSLGIATVIGVTLGIASAKLGRVTSALVQLVAGVGRTIPTYALIVLVAAVSTLGTRPAIIGLVVLGVFPVLVNTLVGIRGVDPGVIEAARGMGMTRPAVLTRVELPIALPLTLAGIRIAAVEIVGTTTLAFAVDGGALGVFISSGLSNNDNDLLLAGAIPAAAIAVAAFALMLVIERVITPKGLRIARRPTNR